MKSFKVNNVWGVYSNTDLMEGRGSDILVGYFTNYSDARLASEGRGVMGTAAEIRQENISVSVFESYSEFEGLDTLKIKERALRKLTDQEKKALGLI
jgi:hypothetical protein